MANLQDGMLFLSFAGEDRQEAHYIAEALGRGGVRVFCSALEGTIEPGTPWIPQLESALKTSSAYAILIGRGPVDGWVRPELDFALNQQALRPDEFPVYPLLLPGLFPDVLPPFLARIEAIRIPETVASGQAGNGEIESFMRRLGIGTPRVSEQGLPEDGPFPGLETFDTNRARFFFGRDGEIRDLCQKIGAMPGGSARWLHVHGASGSGKSSLVRAGLVPAVQRGWLEHPDGPPRRWAVAVFRPGADPMRNLAVAVAKALGHEGAAFDTAVRSIEATADGLDLKARERAAHVAPTRFGLLVVADQLEEAFTQRGRIDRFDKALAGTVARDSVVHLVTTIRTDFLNRFEARLPRLFGQINCKWTQTHHVGHLGLKVLPVLLDAPVRAAGLKWEEQSLRHLVETQFRQALDEDGSSDAESAEELKDSAKRKDSYVPVLAHVLREFWILRERRLLNGQERSILTLRAFNRIGGVRGAIGRSADRVLACLRDDTERDTVLEFFLQLVRVRPGEPHARRTLSKQDALEALSGGERAEQVLHILSGGRLHEHAAQPSRLLVVRPPEPQERDRDQVEIVHETLLEGWKTLRDRINKRRDELWLREELDHMARQWEENFARKGRKHEGLPDSALLALFDRVKKPTPRSKRFLTAARRRVSTLAHKQLLRSVLISLLAVVGMIFALIAETARRTIRWERDRLVPYQDSSRYEDLIARAKQFHPMDRSLGVNAKNWLMEATELFQRTEKDHAFRLAALESKGVTLTAVESGERHILYELLETWARLSAPDWGAAAQVNAMCARAASTRALLDNPSLTTRWNEAIERLRSDSRFDTLALKPVDGLIPLGPDPVSGLEEFADPWTGVVPDRDASGVLANTHDTALVYVLVPPAPYELPHDIDLREPLLVSKTLINCAVWARTNIVLPNNAYHSASGFPQTGMNAADALHCAVALAARLPTEAEWNYIFWAGALPKSVGEETGNWYDSTQLFVTLNLGQATNNFGVVYLRGAWELTADDWHGQNDVSGLDGLPQVLVVRTGQLDSAATDEWQSRRSHFRSEGTHGNLGLRIVRSL